MKKLLLYAGVMFLFASLAMAQAAFSPIAMEIACPAEIGYDFGEEPLNIPFTVSGKPGAFWLVINTHGKADEIVGVHNGFLGWHYVNHIDTTVYVSGRYQRELGDVMITWDGINSDGEKVAEDTYSYYIWGYDDKSVAQKVTDYLRMSYSWDSNKNTVVTYDEQGLVREKPLIFGNTFWYDSDPADSTAWKRGGTAWKWEVGSNPEDLNNLQTTWMPFYQDIADGKEVFNSGQPILDLQDNDYYYHPCRNQVSHTCTVMKWKFIPGGDAEQDVDYMGWETDSEWDVYPVMTYEVPTFTTNPDGSEPYMYMFPCTWHIPDEEWTLFTCVNKDEGEVVWHTNLHEYYMPDDNTDIGEYNSTPNGQSTRGNNLMLNNGWLSCLQEMIDTTGLFEDKYYQDYIVWQNKNGDYFLDRNFEEDSATPWACLKLWGPNIKKCALDDEMFGIYSRASFGGNNLTVVTQDGTGVADMGFFGSVGSPSGTQVSNTLFADSGTQYDGFYIPPVEEVRADYGVYHITFDSSGGLIVPGGVTPGVEEEAQVAYALDQNAPNPFNPTTTIGFTLADAGNVSIDIYNVAGQKVDTLVGNFMDAGSHSVVWDASGFSAGVYFYTIKSGNFTKTMKMTLLK